MRKSAGFLLLLACFLSSLNAQTIRLGQGLPKAKPGISYPLNVHVSKVSVHTECAQCGRVMRADAVLNGQKMELSGLAWMPKELYSVVILPGDYRARLLKDPHALAGMPMYQEYELLLPNGTVWSCSVTGVSE